MADHRCSTSMAAPFSRKSSDRGATLGYLFEQSSTAPKRTILAGRCPAANPLAPISITADRTANPAAQMIRSCLTEAFRQVAPEACIRKNFGSTFGVRRIDGMTAFAPENSGRHPREGGDPVFQRRQRLNRGAAAPSRG